MTQEERALALVNEVMAEHECPPYAAFKHDACSHRIALRAIEKIDAVQAEFDAFRQQVSDAVEEYLPHMSPWSDKKSLCRFIIPKPADPLVEIAREMTLLDGVVRTDSQKAAIREGRAGHTASEDFYDRLRAALAARGLEITPKKGLTND